MRKRPGEKASAAGCGGCFVIIFSIVMLFIGISNFSAADQSARSGSVAFGIIGLVALLLGVVLLRKTLAHANRPLTAPPATSSYKDSPWFPELSHARHSGGGRVTLSPSPRVGGQFIGLLIFGLFWNGFIAFFIIGILNSKEGMILPVLLFISIFAVIGLLILYATVKAFLQMVLVGRTHVELSTEPLGPGARTNLTIRQNGNFSINQVKVSLICREEASHGAGSSRTTHTQIVVDEPIDERRNLTARSHSSLLQTELRIPENAPHSFHASDNKIVWGVRVVMDIPNRPDVDLFFPFRVAPAPAAGGRR